MSIGNINRMKQALAERAAKLAAQQKQTETSKAIHTQLELKNVPIAAPNSDLSEQPETKSKATEIVYNAEQLQAIEYGTSGTEFCLIGPAGTGKTTTLKQVLKNLMERYNINPESPNDKTFAIVCYTRRAARNAAKAVADIGAKKFCMTAHMFLEYQPEYTEYFDEEGNYKKTMRFTPTRHAGNPIRNCRLIVVDEASMLSYEGLYKELKAAAPNAKFIFVGDLFQLPPVFGDAVLGYKLTELPVVELKQVYRQAMDSPIIAFQHNYTLQGKLPSDLDLQRISETATPDKGLEFISFKQDHHDGEVLAEAVANYMIRQLELGHYVPEEDTILVPYGKSFGSIAINYHIADYLGYKRQAVVWEIFAGPERKYLAEGDFVLHNKAECVITKIEANPKYYGKPTQSPSTNLRRNGLRRAGAEGITLNLDTHVEFVQMGINDLLSMDDDSASEMKRAASAIVTLRDIDSGEEYSLSSNGDINSIDFGYCMTIHKSQGSEWRKVWLVLHKFHAAMLNREIIYTGMTRAKDKLTVIYSKQSTLGKKDSSVAKAIKRASIPGKTWQQKAQYFLAKKERK